MEVLNKQTRLSDSTGKMVMTQISKGKAQKSSLDTKDGEIYLKSFYFGFWGKDLCLDRKKYVEKREIWSSPVRSGKFYV